MYRYIGVKEINAKPMNLYDFNAYMGRTVSEGDDVIEGYLVEYTDGGQANTEEFNGYVSWSPKDVFERAYRKTEGMSFGLAIETMKKGNKVARAGWNGKGMFIVMMPEFPRVNDRAAKFIGEDKPLDCQPYIAMYNAQEQWVPGWLASQTDMLADDWVIVE